MAKLKIEIEMDNAAFEESRGAELARILRKLVKKFETGIMDGDSGDWVPLLDTNGNRVGFAAVED